MVALVGAGIDKTFTQQRTEQTEQGDRLVPMDYLRCRQGHLLRSSFILVVAAGRHLTDGREATLLQHVTATS